MNPNSTCPPAGIVEFHPTCPTTAVFPVLETTAAFQIEEMEPGVEMLADQLVTGAEPVFFKTTAPVRPDPQSESTRGTATSVAKEFTAVRARARARAVRVRMGIFILSIDAANSMALGKVDEPAGKLGGRAGVKENLVGDPAPTCKNNRQT